MPLFVKQETLDSLTQERDKAVHSRDEALRKEQILLGKFEELRAEHSKDQHAAGMALQGLQEAVRRTELAKGTAERQAAKDAAAVATLRQEVAELSQVVKEREQEIYRLRELVRASEQRVTEARAQADSEISAVREMLGRARGVLVEKPQA